MMFLIFSGPKLQTDQSTLRIAEIPHDFADRLRQLSHQRRDGEDLIASRKLRVLHQIDDFDVVATGKVFFAQTFKVSECRH